MARRGSRSSRKQRRNPASNSHEAIRLVVLEWMDETIQLHKRRQEKAQARVSRAQQQAIEKAEKIAAKRLERQRVNHRLRLKRRAEAISISLRKPAKVGVLTANPLQIRCRGVLGGTSAGASYRVVDNKVAEVY